VTSAVAVVLAAGSGVRMGLGEPKAFVGLGGASMLDRALAAAAACPQITALIAAVPEGMTSAVEATEVAGKPVTVIVGGSSRQASVLAGLDAAPEGTEVIVCHDAARPFASSALFTSVIKALEHADGAIPVVPVSDTVKRVVDGDVVGTEPREELFLAQTPQAFRTHALRGAHDRASAEQAIFTDDAAVLEWAGYHVRAVPGEAENVKITTAADLARAEGFASSRKDT